MLSAMDMVRARPSVLRSSDNMPRPGVPTFLRGGVGEADLLAGEGGDADLAGLDFIEAEESAEKFGSAASAR